MTKIKPMKYFLRRINGVSLYCRVVIATKIKPRENLTDEIFYRRKIPDLQYVLFQLTCADVECVDTHRIHTEEAAGYEVRQEDDDL